ncbi:MAG: hypothetical protein ABI591_00045 [Kofleriaceae bacterium]
MRAVVLALIAGCGRVAFDDRTFDANPDSNGRTAPALVANDDAFLAGGSSITSSLSNVVAGHLIVLAIGYDHTADVKLALVTGSSGDQFTVLGPADGSPNRQYLAYAIAANSGPDTFTATLDADADTYLELRSHEYANVDAVDPLDQYIAASGTVPIQPSVTLTTTAPNELLFAFVVTVGGVTTAGAGFTAVTTAADDITEDRVAAEPGSYQVTAMSDMGDWTLSAAAIRGD